MLTNACDLSLSPSNTGVECSSAMAATAMLFMVPRNDRFTLSDINTAGGFTAYAAGRISDIPSKRWFPLFGSYAPVRSISDSNETDVIETLDDGSMAFIRYGMYNRTYLATDGGLCLAQHMMSFRGGYSFIEVDIQGKVLFYQPADGQLGGVPTNLAYAPAPEIANLKTTYKNKWMMSFSPANYIQHSEIFAGDNSEDILSLTGLLDVTVAAGVGPQTTTNIFVTVHTDCADTDLVALYPGTGAGAIAQVSNFKITKVSDGTSVTPSAALVVGNQVKLTGTYTTGAAYKVALAIPSVLATNGVDGYEGTTAATVTIP
jgi:hypothetical protein